jgi:hypothetical protein
MQINPATFAKNTSLNLLPAVPANIAVRIRNHADGWQVMHKRRNPLQESIFKGQGASICLLMKQVGWKYAQ